jgi:hypothetical protein
MRSREKRAVSAAEKSPEWARKPMSRIHSTARDRSLIFFDRDFIGTFWAERIPVPAMSIRLVSKKVLRPRRFLDFIDFRYK